MSALLETREVMVSFPGVLALDRVSFQARGGEVRAIVGANGAGKSTLLKVLTGAYAPASGTVAVDGEPRVFRGPRDAKRLGIEVVHQEVDAALIPFSSVAENVLLDRQALDRRFWVRTSRLEKEARVLLEPLAPELDVRKRASDLTLAEKQLVLIARALGRDARFLLLDEPTAPLGPSETEALFAVVKTLVRRGLGVLFISHRLPEVLRVASQVTVLRDGRVVADEPLAGKTTGWLVEQMLGKKLEDEYPRRGSRTPSEVLLEVRGLSDGHRLKGVDLSVRSGEVVGVAGQVGAGKSELCKALFGASTAHADQFALAGKTRLPRQPREAVLDGLALVPEERRKEGVLVDESVAFNLSAAAGRLPTRFGFIDFGRERAQARDWIGRLSIKTPSERQKVALLSGGNQQKVAVGKWLAASNASVFLFDEPTKGIDIGAKKDMFELVGRLADEGKGVVYATSEFPELLGIADRIVVLYDGRVVAERQASATTEEELLLLSTGGHHG
jgi:simple sugar transport system ATP-binding protein